MVRQDKRLFTGNDNGLTPNERIEFIYKGNYLLEKLGVSQTLRLLAECIRIGELFDVNENTRFMKDGNISVILSAADDCAMTLEQRKELYSKYEEQKGELEMEIEPEIEAEIETKPTHEHIWIRGVNYNLIREKYSECVVCGIVKEYQDAN